MVPGLGSWGQWEEQRQNRSDFCSHLGLRDLKTTCVFRLVKQPRLQFNVSSMLISTELATCPLYQVLKAFDLNRQVSDSPGRSLHSVAAPSFPNPQFSVVFKI